MTYLDYVSWCKKNGETKSIYDGYDDYDYENDDRDEEEDCYD